jgi:hypothetical protein
MTGGPANSGRQQGGKFGKGQSGNPAGRATGSRNKATLLFDKLAEADGEEILRQTLADAKHGDANARKLVLDRIWPVRKGRLVSLNLPLINTASDIVAALGLIAEEIGSGSITPEEGAAVAAVLETKRRALETTEIEARITALEKERTQ